MASRWVEAQREQTSPRQEMQKQNDAKGAMGRLITSLCIAYRSKFECSP
jgi:hypothetical protein